MQWLIELLLQPDTCACLAASDPWAGSRQAVQGHVAGSSSCEGVLGFEAISVNPALGARFLGKAGV